MNDAGEYDDIINLPHHVSNKHKPMSLDARAAQFAPFAALTGFEDAVAETARYIDKRIEIDEEQKNILDCKLQELKKHLSEKPNISITYFIPDLKKDGGIYATKKGAITKIDEYKDNIILNNDTLIPISEIIEIDISAL